MNKIKSVLAYMRKEAVLSIAWILAALSTLLVQIDREYLGYIDVHTLGLLFALMAVMAGLKRMGIFRTVAEALLKRTHTTRQLEAVLIFLPFFSSMLVTNDVALITFVPFALEVLAMAGLSKRIVPVVIMQTIAANLGSMSTPVGNPQNLFLYSYYGLTMGDFFSAVLPLSLVSMVLLAVFVAFSPSGKLSEIVCSGEETAINYKKLAMLLVLFVLCLLVVAKVVSLWIVCLLTLVLLLVFDRETLKDVDYALLFTFIGFFIFVGNLGRVPVFTELFAKLLSGNEVLCSVFVSQFISNVPAALLLAGFTDSSRELLIGVNLGGLGTLIASMASLISYKYIAKSCSELKGKYLLFFTLANIAFLAVLLVVWAVLL